MYYGFLTDFYKLRMAVFWHFAVYFVSLQYKRRDDARGRKLAGTAGTTEKEEAVISLFCSKIEKNQFIVVELSIKFVLLQSIYNVTCISALPIREFDTWKAFPNRLKLQGIINNKQFNY